MLGLQGKLLLERKNVKAGMKEVELAGKSAGAEKEAGTGPNFQCSLF